VNRTLAGHANWVVDVAFSPVTRLLATASYDRTARLWDVATGAPARTLTGHTGPVHGVAFSPDGSLIATVSGDRSARVWDVATGAPALTFIGQAGSLWGVAFHPAGTQLATASSDKTVWVWDMVTARPTHVVTGHSAVRVPSAGASGPGRTGRGQRDLGEVLGDAAGHADGGRTRGSQRAEVGRRDDRPLVPMAGEVDLSDRP